MTTATAVYDTDGTPWHAGDYPARAEGEDFDEYTARLLRAVRSAIVEAGDSYDGARSTRLVESQHEADVVLRVEDNERVWNCYVRATAKKGEK